MSELHGILLLDKPPGVTSNKALQQVKRLFNTKSKAGHTGSLDPLATGMLPICFGEATKFSTFLFNSDKTYIVIMQLGIKTDTGDLDGAVVCQETSLNYCFTNQQIGSILANFIGDIWQTPPIYSAIKQNGVRLYKLARKKTANIVVPSRLIKIYSIKLLDYCNIKQQIKLEVHCSKGTYIRTLVEDIAAKLNCLATVIYLRRIAVGYFDNKSKLTDINDLTKFLAQNNTSQQLLLPTETCLVGLKTIRLTLADSMLLKNGQSIQLSPYNLEYPLNSLICLKTEKDDLLGVGRIIENNKLVAKRLVKTILKS